jgi:endogenous inhibitor of DNA gyrase (YacG/DUF329 family)
MEYSTTNPNRPFCSAACQGDDLVAWADEKYFVAVEIKPEDADDIEAQLLEKEFKIH